MAKILVSGFLSRQCNPQKNKRDVMVSWLLAEALRDMGHEVEHRNPTMTEDYEDFDHIFLGLAALHSIGCNRSYGWLAAYLKNVHKDKVTLYVDDVDTAKVLSGIRVMKNDPKKLIKPYYVYRLEYELASQPEWHSWLMQGVDLLHDYAWPTVIVPMFPWGDPEKMRSQLPNATDIVPIDFTPYVPEYVGEDEWAPERDRMWVTEIPRENRWLGQQRPVFPITHYGKNELKRPDDRGLVEHYAKAWGVIDPGLDNGFFYSRLIYAAQARALFITKWQNVQPLGDAYALLADTAAGFDDDTRTAWAEAQNAALRALTWDRDQVKEALNARLKTKVDA
jgi:hypothetical protein